MIEWLKYLENSECRRATEEGQEPYDRTWVWRLRQVDVLTAQGTPVSDAIRLIGVIEVTYYLYGRLTHCKSTVI